MSSEPAPGTVLDGKFRLERLLGEGGMGSVWAATNLTTRKAVALKLLKGGASAGALRRFVREARLASLVQHPNLVAVHDVAGLTEGMPALVMELLEGETLRARLAREPRVPLPELARLLLPVVDALRLAHRSGIVHRDLKPDNLFLQRAPGGQLKLVVLDFGIAKRLVSEEQEQSAQLTGTGDILGTFQYMAPEQLFGETDITAAADIWALGVILHECLCGERPLGGSGFAQLLREAVLKGKLPGLEQSLAAQPLELRVLISRALSVVPGERPPLEQLESVLASHAGDGASRELAVEQPVATGEALATPPPVASDRDPLPTALAQTELATPRSRRRRPFVLALFAVLAAGVVYAARQVLVDPPGLDGVAAQGGQGGLAVQPASASLLPVPFEVAAPAAVKPPPAPPQPLESNASGLQTPAAAQSRRKVMGASTSGGPGSSSAAPRGAQGRAREPAAGRPAEPPAQPSKTEFKPVKRVPF